MKATYTAFGGRLQCEVQGDSIKEIIKQIGPIAEILDSDTACGCCQSENIHPRCRKAGDYEYFELVCSDCGAQMSFGQAKDMKSLFPKRKGHPETRGWSVYVADRQQSSAPASSGPRRNPNQRDPELERLIAKLNNMPTADDQEYELGDLYHAIVEVNGEGAAAKAWDDATKQVGPLSKDLANAGRIARLMWPALRG